MMTPRKLFLCIPAFLALAVAVAIPSDAEERPPNVVLIFADDLGYGDLSCYGASKLKTPNIDRLATEGRRFTDAHSASAVCTPSRYGLITGRYPFRKGLSKAVFLKTGLVIDEDRTTVADVMKKAGYAAACIGKWHLGFGEKSPDWNGDLKPGPLELGFDYYYGVPIVNSHPPFVYVENHRVVGLVPDDPFVFGKNANTQMVPEKMGFNQIGGADAAHALYDDYAVGTRLAEKSVEWIEANRKNPFFLYLATTNIHHPFTPAKRFQGTSDCGLYGDFVHELDWIVGEVMATLEKNGLDENTLVIFTSDNGGMINETGQKAIAQGHDLNGELLGFKFDAWEGGHRVPFIARWPGQIPADSVSDQLISNVDLLGTLAALTGQELESDEGPDSFNVLPALTGDPEKPIRDHLVSGAAKATHLAFRDCEWVFIDGKGGGGFGSPKVGSHAFGGPAALKFSGQINSDVVDGRLKKDAPSAQLYEIGPDVSQSYNVIRENAERAEAMRARLEAIKAGKGTRPGLDRSANDVRGFRTIPLAEEFHAESAALADINNDGNADVVYGPFWFAGPDFKTKHFIYKPSPFKTGTYSNNFFSYAEDLDGDGWKDVLVLGFPAREASTYWFKNPGVFDNKKPWERFEVFAGVENESPVWADVTGDGKKEILCSIGGQFGFVAPADRATPELPWVFTSITPENSTGGKFTHGLGFGDVNGDGRNDLLEKSGWWEQPEEGLWIKHPYVFSETKGGSQMFAYDLDGDGDNDVVSALEAHGYGLAWFEQISGSDGEIDFRKHLIMGEKPEESKYGIAFSQLHALRLDDIDGDGVKDIVTGKRYFAHGGKDPGGKDAPVIYWFRTSRGKEGAVDFVPYQIHDKSGVGVDVVTGDLNDDSRIDIVVGNKMGCFVHFQTEEKAGALPAVVKGNPTPAQSLAAEVIIEGESMNGSVRSGTLKRQTVKLRGGKWSGDAQAFWLNGKVGDVATFSLPVAEDGNYDMAAAMTKAKDYAIVQFSLNGVNISNPIDLYNGSVIRPDPVEVGKAVRLEKSGNQLEVKIVGANPAALKKHGFGLDFVILRTPNSSSLNVPAPPAATAPAKKSGKGLKEGNSLDAEPLSPEEQRAKFIVPDGFVVELVASEETGLANPTSIAFDDAGRLWATTAVEYPHDKNPEIWKNSGKDKIVVIDQPHLRGLQPLRTFADGMVMPMSVLPYRSGAIVAQGPEIVFLDDTNDDGKADERSVLITGFGVQDTHTLPHQLVRSPGGRVTFSQGVLNSGLITDAEGKYHPFNKTLIASMTPKGTDFRIIGTGMNNIWAWAQNRVGRVFIHEANDFGHSLTQFEEDSSYRSFRVSQMHPDAPIHPPTASGLNLGGTAFSGIAISDDNSGSFPAPWKDKFFVANPILKSINTVSGELGDDDVWQFAKEESLVVCEDPMFRPVGLTFGPDGCLYIVDWYNRIISHNEVDRKHPARDKSHGRIWRIRHKSQGDVAITDFTKTAAGNLPEGLKSDSKWAMRAAWHQIADRMDPSVVPELVKLLNDDKIEAGIRIHALWSLEELGHFDEALWKELFTQPDAELRREAVRSLLTLEVPMEKACALLRNFADEKRWSVRYEVLRFLRRVDGAIPSEDLAWLRGWIDPDASKTKAGNYLALDGSYQNAFQDFLFGLAETKTQLPVMAVSKWSKVIDTNEDQKDPGEIANRIAAVKAALPKADTAQGELFTRTLCLTCHAIGGEGVGFAPPLDGSANRDLDGLITAIIDPNAAMENVFRSFRIDTKQGEVFEGFNQAETRSGITLLTMGGAKQNIPFNSIKRAGYIDGKSVMLDVTGGMTAEQIADIVGYLQTVK